MCIFLIKTRVYLFLTFSYKANKFDLFNKVNTLDASNAVTVSTNFKCGASTLIDFFLDKAQVKHDVYHNMRVFRSSPR